VKIRQVHHKITLTKMIKGKASYVTKSQNISFSDIWQRSSTLKMEAVC